MPQVLSCEHVGDVVIDPPWHLSKEMIAALRITTVAHGTNHDPDEEDDGSDPYGVPKAMGIYVRIPSRSALTVEAIMERVQENHGRLSRKISRKSVSEREYYAQRYGFGAEGDDAAPGLAFQLPPSARGVAAADTSSPSAGGPTAPAAA